MSDIDKYMSKSNRIDLRATSPKQKDTEIEFQRKAEREECFRREIKGEPMPFFYDPARNWAREHLIQKIAKKPELDGGGIIGKGEALIPED